MKRIAIICVLNFWTLSSTGQNFNPLLAARLQDTLNVYLGIISNIKGISCAVYVPGQGTWYGCGGISHTGVPVDSGMQFGIASNTKLFVAAALLKLAENQLLSLDDSIHEWLPPYANIPGHATIRQLLNHTSGVSDPIFTSNYTDTIINNPGRVFTPQEVIGWLNPPFFPPGTGWAYSNVNYILAGMIAEIAGGTHISGLIRNMLLNPLNMDSTFYDVEEPVNGVLAHRWFNGIDYHDTLRIGLNTAGGAAGAMFSTSGELIQWYRALMSGQLLTPSSMQELMNFVPTGTSYIYGLGLESQVFFGHETMGHGGSTWGYKSRMVYEPCSGIIVSGLSNSFPSGNDGLTMLLFKTAVQLLPSCPGPITGDTMVCEGSTLASFNIAPVSGATGYEWVFPAGFSGSSNTNSLTLNVGSGAVSGLVSVRGVNNYGAGSYSSIYVQVNPAPPLPVITQTGDTLTSSSSSGNQWYNSTGAISGATGQQLIVSASDTYFVIISQNGCPSDTSNQINVTVSNTVQDYFSAEYTVLPNPFSEFISVSNKTGSARAELKLVDYLSRLVTLTHCDLPCRLETTALAPGVYTLLLTSDGNSAVIKLVKY